MRITQVISDSNVGGAGILLASICKSLADEFDFEIIIPMGSALKERLPKGLKITELPFSPDKSFSKNDIGIFYKHFKSNPPDILHTHASLSSRLAGKLSGVRRCISTRHCAKADEKTKKLGFLKRNIYNYCTDMTVSTADFATANLKKEGVPKERIVTIKNGAERPAAVSNTMKAKILRDLGIKDESIIIGSSARLESVKGQDLILRAAPGIIRRFPEAFFLFLGDGSKKDEYMRLSSSLGIEKNVRFAGYVKNPTPYQSIFTLNLNASRGTETSPLAISECMALGIPTVASDFGGNAEMIENEKSGLLFPTDDIFALEAAVCKIISDAELYKKLSESARIRYDSVYSPEKMADAYRSLYHSLGSNEG